MQVVKTGIKNYKKLTLLHMAQTDCYPLAVPSLLIMLMGIILCCLHWQLTLSHYKIFFVCVCPWSMWHWSWSSPIIKTSWLEITGLSCEQAIVQHENTLSLPYPFRKTMNKFTLSTIEQVNRVKFDFIVIFQNVHILDKVVP